MKVKTAKPLDSKQMKEDKHYNNGSSPVMNVAADSDMKSRARDLLMRNLAIFRSKTESKTTLVSGNLTENILACAVAA